MWWGCTAITNLWHHRRWVSIYLDSYTLDFHSTIWTPWSEIPLHVLVGVVCVLVVTSVVCGADIWLGLDHCNKSIIRVNISVTIMCRERWGLWQLALNSSLFTLESPCRLDCSRLTFADVQTDYDLVAMIIAYFKLPTKIKICIFTLKQFSFLLPWHEMAALEGKLATCFV